MNRRIIDKGSDSAHINNYRPLNWTIDGIETHLICHIINSRVVENKNCLLTRSMLIIILYDVMLFLVKNGVQ